jgi:hypothetical protein
MEAEEILKNLEYNTGKFPRRALESAIKRPEEISPHLLRVLQRAVERPDEVKPGYMAHIYAMYLLAQFRETRAYPSIVRFCQLPGELPLDLTGDVITEDMDRILASVCGGDTKPIEGLVEDASLNEYVRDAALKAILALVGDGQKDRSEAAAYFKSLFGGKLERTYSFVWEGLLSCCYRLYPEEFIDDIEKAYDDGLIFGGGIIEAVERALEEEKEDFSSRLASRYQGLIGNTLEEIQWWSCFKEDRKWEKQKGERRLSPVSVVPVAQSKRKKVGRNDPCPCGSGKKYKKCCGV